MVERTLSLQCRQLLALVLHADSWRPRSREMITMLQCWQRLGFQSHLQSPRSRHTDTDTRFVSSIAQTTKASSPSPHALVFVVVDFRCWELFVAELALRRHRLRSDWCWYSR